MDPFLGEIKIFAGDYAPQDWRICDGSLLSISEYSPLYSLLGTIYGGDGISNFGLPDLRGRLAIGQGTGPGLTKRTLGSSGGVETVTIALPETPLHNHAIKVSKTTANNVLNPSATTYLGTVSVPGTSGYAYLDKGISGLVPKALDDSVIHPFAGDGQPHSNIMPVIGLNYIICTNGIYPSPS